MSAALGGAGGFIRGEGSFGGSAIAQAIYRAAPVICLMLQLCSVVLEARSIDLGARSPTPRFGQSAWGVEKDNAAKSPPGRLRHCRSSGLPPNEPERPASIEPVDLTLDRDTAGGSGQRAILQRVRCKLVNNQRELVGRRWINDNVTTAERYLPGEPANSR